MKSLGLRIVIFTVLLQSIGGQLFIPDAVTINQNFRAGSSLTTLSCGSAVTPNYRILSINPDINFLQVRSGVVALTIDAINLSPGTYTINIECVFLSMSDRANLTVIRVDENEFAPIFADSTLVVSIPEDAGVSTVVTVVMATDDDLGVNGNITYSITTPGIQSTFGIHPSTGQISLLSSLDFEQRFGQSYQFSVSASNPPSQNVIISGSNLVMINVINIDDTSPVFNLSNYRRSLPENNTEPLSFLAVNCTDVDTDNSRIRYGFGSGDRGSFQLDSLSGQLSVPTNGLDYETKTFYSFVVICYDNSLINSSSSAVVDISVLPVNEMHPELVQRVSFPVSLSESTPVGTVVVSTLNATSLSQQYAARDSDDGPDGNITYTFAQHDFDASQSEFFSIDVNTGEVVVEHQLDVDSNTSLAQQVSGQVQLIFVSTQIRITVCDIFPPPPPLNSNCSNMLVHLLITLENEFQPQFSQDEYDVSVPEDLGFNNVVLTVTCTDHDLFRGQFSAIDFVNASQNVLDRFLIEHTTGVIRLRTTLDYETTTNYGFHLRCNDSAGLEDLALVVIEILPINDNFPMFDQLSYIFNVSRSTPANRFEVGRVSATDLDNGFGGQLLYSVEPNPYFDIASDGAVLLINSVQNVSDSGTRFQARVYDGPDNTTFNSATALVAITFTDGNMIRPEFRLGSRAVVISELTPISTVITTIQCIDGEAGLNGAIRYSIRNGNTDDVFDIDAITGVITVAAVLTLPQNVTEDQYFLDLVCEDLGVPRFSSLATILIRITQDDSSPPVITRDNIFVFVEENSTLNTVIVSINATDLDTDFLVFRLVNESHPGVFIIDPPTGQVIIAAPLDRETVSRYTMTVVVTEQRTITGPVRSDSATLTVLVRDVNDNTPSCDQSSLVVTINDTSVQGDPIVTLDCSDPDVGVNGNLTYSLAEDFGVLAVNETGTIYLQNSLSLVDRNILVFVVLVSDQGTPVRRSNSYHVTIRISSTNRNIPRFLNLPASIFVLESLSVQEVVFTAEGDDPDRGSFGQLTYRIVSASDDSTFDIIPNTGSVLLRSRLNYFEQQVYTLNISVEDTDFVVSEVLVINVVDVNEFSPSCEQTLITVTAIESLPLMSRSLSCSDEDLGPNGELTFTIVSGNDGIFSVNNSGVISTQQPLDFEQAQRHSLLIMVSDGGSPPNTLNVTVTVVVQAVNEFAPIFDASSYEVTIPEDSIVGMGVLTVMASDSDLSTHPDGQIVYSISGLNASLFTISSSGLLQVAGDLDRETQEIFSFAVIASDQGIPLRSMNATVNIILSDVDDNSPRFTQMFYRSTHNQQNTIQDPILTVKCADADIGSNADVVYSIDSNSADSQFYQISSSGLIQVNGMLIVSRTYLFGVVCSGPPPFNRSDTAVVIVVAVVNTTITFLPSSTYNQSIDEDTIPIYDILTISAFSSTNMSLTYSLLTDSSVFQVDSSTGIFRLINTLDYEMEQSYVLQIQASDNGNPPNVAEALVNILVRNVNDEVPVITTIPPVLNRTEGPTLRAEVLLDFECSDEDDGIFGAISFRIERGNEQNLFSISSSGTVSLIGDIDYEAARSFTLEIVCEDGGNPALSDSATLSISVLPVNDNPPSFLQNTYTIGVSESVLMNSHIGSIVAMDADLPPHNGIHYSIISGNTVPPTFEITPTTGELTLLRELDYETLRIYSFVVLAEDSGGSPNTDFPILNDTTTVIINVIDVNDNSPVLSRSAYSGSIEEEAGVGAGVVLVNAISCTDSDSGLNGEFFFSISGSTFQIHPTTGAVSAIENLNIETTQQTRYSLSVQCVDRGSPPLSSVATLFVIITDINEFSPRFTNESGYIFSVLESAAVGDVVGVILAIDEDAGDAGIVSYSFINASGTPFSLDSETGTIILSGGLDFETQTHQYALQALARDNAGNSNEATVIINVVNVDDHLPVFSSNVYFLSVRENVPVETLAGRVQCTDADNTALGISVTYAISSSPFAIDSTTGEITVVGVLDLEAIPRYSVSVVCIDAASNAVSASVSISLLPFNDFTPVFVHLHFNASVVENTASGNSIQQVRATDDDIMDYFAITYSIVSGNDAALFSIEQSSGILRVNGTVDRENMINHTLVVQAQNLILPSDVSGSSPLSSTATVSIEVLDVNDNFPVITPSDPPPVFILESDGPFAFVLQLTCSDVDEGPNGTTTFSITPGSRERFQILQNGMLRTTTLIRTNEVVTVTCHDSGTPSLSSSVDVSVNTMSINNHPPMFESASYSLRVREDTAIGQTVACINATDRDGPDTPDGIVEYSLHFTGSGVSKFGIMENTGCIFVSIALDFDLAMLFEYIIIATDMGVMPLQGNATLTIEIIDTVRDPPRFQSTAYTRVIPESAPIGSFIAQIACADPDVNDTVTYGIVGAMPQFSIDSRSGNLVTTSNLDFEIDISHTIIVSCTDSFGLQDIAEVFVTVLPINEYAPTFFSDAVEFEENSIIGREVTTLEWMDSDSGVDGEVTFSITSGNVNDVFSITSAGRVLVRGNLDRESIPKYYLNITIADQSVSEPRSSFGQLNVTIIDINDNQPQFRTDPYMFGPLEGNETLGHFVGLVSCMDNDTGSNAQTTFRVSPDNVNFTLFAVDSESGRITVNGDLRTRGVDTVTFTVLCIDLGAPPLAGSARVLVRVEEINRYPPEFLNSSYSIEVREDTGILEETILTVRAVDMDTGINGMITYHLLDTFNGRFFLDQRSGDLSLIQPLDFEQQSSYLLIAIARDGAVDSAMRLRSTVEIAIQVIGVNEHIPACQNAIYVVVINATSQGSVVDFMCADGDKGPDGQLNYSILRGNEDGFFVAEQDTLQIPTPFRPADGRERFMLQVLIADSGVPSKRVTIDVIIIFSFDNLAAPQFSQSSYNISVNELTEVGTVVALLMATDTDPNLQGQITYSVLNPDNFRIDANNGNLFVAAPLDFETFPFLTFSVMAEDGDPIQPLFDFAIVNVRVINNNDNTPECDQNLYTSQVASNALPNTTVVTLNCSDLDQNTLSYAILTETIEYGIDSNSGRVFVTGRLTQPTYLINVEVSDNEGQMIVVFVSIATLFANLEPPVFDVSEYSFSVLETAPLLTVVGSVQATDGDSIARDLTYSLLDAGLGEFYVNPSSGGVVLTVPLDYEVTQHYRFTVQVADTGSFDGSNILSTTATIVINVNNTNDNQPMFSDGGIYGRTIHERTPSGTSILTVFCTDDDLVPYGLPAITSEAFDNIPFTLRQVSTGEAEISVSEPLSGPNAYFVNVTCTDGGSQKVEGQVFLFVPEPLAPLFSEPVYEWFVSETSGTGTAYTSVRATSDDNSRITYSIADGNNDGIFFIDPSSGVISLVVTLDYETQRRHGLIVRAVDGSNRESNVLLLVQVLDANDEVPLTPPSAVLNITQNQTPGYPVGSVECIDADANINNTVFNYTFSPPSDQFSIDEFGVIRLEVGLDNTPVYVIPVVCFDIRNPAINSTGIVTIEVEFVNLHQPVFRYPLYIFQADEDLEVLSLVGNPVVATDNDIGSFSELVYAIEEEQDQFFVESATGRIGLLTSLDREVHDMHIFTVIAIDGGPSAADNSRMTGSTTVMVTIQDTNDNAPSPSQLSYVQLINTNHTVRSPVLTVSCSDPDKGNNGSVIYSLSPPSIVDNFVIQSNGTILLAQEQPNQAVYSFFVICTDRGSQPLDSSALVTVTVNFLALSAPVFSEDHYNASILENATVTTPVVRVQATPSDASITVVYSLAEGNTLNSFFINSFTGEITIRNPLDAREVQDYILTVRAGNSGSDQLFSFATVSIFVGDINDNSPRFGSQFYTGTVNESSTLLTPVATVECRDSDVNSDISYSITGGLSNPPAFNITQGGLVVVAGEIDYESTVVHTLQITCIDGGPEPRTAVTTVRINVSPVNEFIPQFSRREYAFTATENDFGALIGRVEATDRDAGVHGSLAYLLQDPGNFSIIFVDPTSGDVLVSNNLDYEYQATWNLTVIARDEGGLQSSIPLNIEVINVNDVFPILEPESAVHSIAVDREVGFPIQSYTCTDADGSDTSISIVSGNSMGYFELSSNNIVRWTNQASGLLSNSVVSLTLICVDGNDAEQFDQSIIAVSIVVTDAVSPVFSETLYSISVAEDALIDTVVLMILAVGDNQVNYSLLSLPTDFPFNISSSEGNISLVGALNREVESFYSFFVSATDLITGAIGLSQVEISVIDINDNPPVIAPSMQILSLPENFQTFTAPLIVFTCTDSDTGPNNNISYLITDGNTDDTFRVDGNGRVFLSHSLDFESISNFTLEITCLDSLVSPLMDMATLFVSVTGFNEHPPVFINSTYFFSVSELALIGDMIGRVGATDRDAGLDGDVTYIIISGSGEFIMDETSGELFLAESLNFESQSHYDITVEARDGALDTFLQMTSTTEILVEVTQENEHTPTCRNAIYVSVVTATSQGSVVDFFCTDRDVGLDGQLTYSILSGNEDGYFTVENDSLVVPVPFYPADGREQFMLQVLVRDLGVPSRNTIIDIVIIFSFDNLAAPQFSQSSYNISVNELTEVGTVVALLMATDTDPSLQGQITYSVLNSDNFRIDASSGNLFVAAPLDFETFPFLTFSVMAEDGDPLLPLFDIATINVRVINNNDNAPECDRNLYTSQIASNALPDTTVITLNCSDLDQNPLRYTILTATTAYSIDSNTGRIFVAGPLLDTISLLTVRVSGDDDENINVSVAITTLFSNQEPPQFDNANYVFFVSESAVLLTTVGLVQATDPDSDNSDLVYSLTDPAVGEFYVNPSTGGVVLSAPLDYESVRQYSFTVQVMDAGSFDGSNVLSNTASITVNVNNSNDNQPTFSSGGIYGSTISEVTPIGFTILAISCTDNDDSPFGSPSITSSDFDSSIPFELIDVSTGEAEIRVSGSLSGEVTYFLNVTCTDGGGESMEGLVFIFIPEPLAPTFSQTLYEWSLSELAAVRSMFTDIQASSNDNSTITYSISGGNEAGMFYIDPSSGQISLVMTLDYEKQTQHVLIVRAVDGASRQTTVLLLVQVQNANEPPLTPPSALLNITQNQTPGYLVGSVECVDAGASINNTVFNYTFNPPSDRFSIDEFGVIRLEVELDNTPVYVIPVVCFDIRNPAVNSTGIVTIEVEFVNLHQPVFQLPLYIFQVDEDLEVLSLVGNPVVATDNDIGSFSELVYAIEEEQDQFFVESVTGRIGLLTSLDREVQGLHSFTVIAIDGGPSAADNSRMTGSTTVMVTIQDTNDNAPSPSRLSYVQSINTNHTVRSPVLTVSCSDPDEGNNGSVIYSLSPPSIVDNFVIQSNGTILLAQEQPNQAVYSFFVICTDRGSQPLDSSALVTVTVNFLALSAPVFSEDHYNASILENATVTTPVVRVQATPSDASITVVYSLVEGNTLNSFFVNSFTGEIAIRNPLDAREVQNYILTVRAGNSGSDQLFSFATVSIFVGDINDNSPRFESQFYTGTVNESSTLLTPVATVECRDSDVNSDISYSIAGGLSNPPVFNITQGGLVVVAGEIDYESTVGYSLQITCSDGGPEPRTAVTTVRINVSPVNEFRPQFVRTQYTFQAIENDFGALIGRVEASDGDRGVHGSIAYLLQDPGNFSVIFVDPTSGDVHVSNNLDYEFQAIWNLTVIARDGGGLESSIPLNIEVINVNDVFPILEPESSVHNVTVGEDPGTLLQSYTCSDADGSVTTLSIINGNSEGYFELRNNIVIWTGRASNLTTNLVTSLTVRCQDDNATEQFDESIIAVSILVTAANPPVFSETLYSVSVPEDTSINTVVLTVSAVGENMVDYSLLSTPTDFPFHVSSLEGNVSLIAALNREVTSRYSFFVSATDLTTGATGLSSVQISIIDINDNPPIITPPTQSVQLPENFELSSSFAQFTCTDRDTGVNGNVQFQITNGDPHGTFNIGRNGYVSLTQPLDFEILTNYTLNITCSDSAQPPLLDFAMLVVIVEGVNEYPPVFTNSTYFFSISEYARTGDVVGGVSASDLDAGLDGEIRYSVLSGSGVGFFNLNRDGSIVTSVLPLNATVHPALQLNVRAVDGGQLHSDTAVVVTVEDVNEPPQFSGFGNYFVRASTDLSPGATVLQFTCFDIDTGENSAVALEITNIQTGLDMYLLTTERGNAQDANLVANSTISAGSYTLAITCTDRGNPPIASTTSITIRVDTLNTPPMFVHDVIPAVVTEDILPGTPLFTVNATDAESEVRYTITSGTGVGTFQVDSATGIVSTFLPLDYEVMTSYSLSITASDLSLSDQMSATIQASIIVINVNDIAPNLVPGLRVISLREDANASSASSLVVYTCSDLDGSETTLTISSTDRHFPFGISPSGEIFLRTFVDYEILTSHTISVTCTDREVRVGEGTIMQSSTTLTIAVEPVNIYRPVFISQPSFEITESALIGDNVGTIQATDDDMRGRVTFSSSSSTDTFHLDARGNITVVSELDYEVRTEYMLGVTANDNDNAQNVQPKTTSSVIVIRVTDVNDNQPTCTFHVLSIVFETGSYNSPPLSLAQLNCSDQDSGLNGQLQYSIVEDSLPLVPEGSFILNETSGVLRFEGTIDASGSHVLQMLVQDLGVPPLSARVTIAIQVQTADDTRPRFNQTVFRVNVSENHLSPSVILRGQDIRDDFINPLGERVEFSLQASTANDGVFFINSMNADITLTDSTLLDYDRGRRQYTLIIQARIKSVVETAVAEVNVLDFNDNSPQFSRSIYNGSILENEPPGMFILRVEASDIDSGENGRFEYSIQGGNLVVNIDPRSGNITAAQRFDREVADRYTIVVLATDMGVPPQTGSATVTIAIDDVNDRPPSFIDAIYIISINNTIQPGEVVVMLRASDEDIVGDLTFMINDLQARTLFVVSSNGALRLRSAGLPQDYSPQYSFTVTVSDGIFTDMASVVIYVVSLTTDTVLFEENVEGEQYHVRGFLRQNFDISSEATYAIIQGDAFGEFEIDSSGILSVSGTLDRENTSRYDLAILVLDNVTSVNIELLVTVNVRDQNDNKPMFSSQTYTFNVSEGPYEDMVSFGSVTAIDLDQPDTSASTIEYSLVTPDDALGIDQRTGELFVKAGSILDREKTPNVTILAQARDRGEPTPLFTTALLIVLLDDINDNDPEFVPLAVEQYFVVLPSSKIQPNTRLDKIIAMLPMGIRIEVATISVTDPDPTSSVTATLEGTSTVIGFVDPTSTELELITLGEIPKEFCAVLQIVLRDQPVDEENNPVIRNISFIGETGCSGIPGGLPTQPAPFFETEAGIAVIVVICLLILIFAVSLFCLLCYIRNRRDKDPLKDAFRTTTIAQRILTEADRKGKKKLGPNWDYHTHSDVHQLQFPDLSPEDYETDLLYPPMRERESSFMSHGGFDNFDGKPFMPRPPGNEFGEPFIPRPGDEFGDPVDYYDDNEHSSPLMNSRADPFSLQETDTSVLSSLHGPLGDLDDSLGSYGDSMTDYTMGPVLKAMLGEWSMGDELLSKKRRKRKISREQQHNTDQYNTDYNDYVDN